MADAFSCPQCGILLRRSPALLPGVLVECPKCTHQFRVPDLEAPALPSLELDDTPEPPIRRGPPPPMPDSPFGSEDSAAPPPPRSSGRTADRLDPGASAPSTTMTGRAEAEDRPRRRRRVETLPRGRAVDFGESFRLACS